MAFTTESDVVNNQVWSTLWDLPTQCVYIACPYGATTGGILVYDVEKKAWYRWELNASCFYPYNGKIYCGTRNGIFYEMDSTSSTDGSTAIPLVFGERMSDLGMPNVEKYLKGITINGTCSAGAGTVKVNTRTDNSSAPTVTTTSSLTFPCTIKYSHTRFTEIGIEITLATTANFRYEGMNLSLNVVRTKQAT